MQLFQTFDESSARNRQGVANLQSRQTAHELAGTALADSKDALDGVAVQVVAFGYAELSEGGANPWEPGGFRRHKKLLPFVYFTSGNLDGRAPRPVFLVSDRFGLAAGNEIS